MHAGLLILTFMDDRSKTRRVIGLVAAAGLALLAGPVSAAGAAERDLVVVDSGAASVVRVNSSTGSQSPVTAGQNLVSPSGIAEAPDGSLLVSDRDAFGGSGGVIRVQPGSGAQSVVSSGVNFHDPTGLALAADGTLLVTDDDGEGAGALVRVDPATGVQSIVSSGGLFDAPEGVAVAPDGSFLVVDRKAFDGYGGVIRVDPLTGGQTAVASGGNFVRPRNIALAGDGRILVTDKKSPLPKGMLIAVAADGAQTIVTSGGLLNDPRGMLVQGTEAVIADPGMSDGAGLERVNLSTGEQAVVSAGGLFVHPEAVALATFPDTPPGSGAPLPAPRFGETVNLVPVSGVIRVAERRGNRIGSFKDLTDPAQIRVGTAVDASRGRLKLTTARANGKLQSGVFHGGRFVIEQRRADRGLTELSLIGRPPVCQARRSASSSASRPRRRLWGNAHGRFRTRGIHSVATVRGTKWLVEDRCGGTLTRVARGAVSVRDFKRKRTVVVRRGQSYVARARR
jgi:DNA-binding beta-propeller fold protein YncE